MENQSPTKSYFIRMACHQRSSPHLGQTEKKKTAETQQLCPLWAAWRIHLPPTSSLPLQWAVSYNMSSRSQKWTGDNINTAAKSDKALAINECILQGKAASPSRIFYRGHKQRFPSLLRPQESCTRTVTPLAQGNTLMEPLRPQGNAGCSGGGGWLFLSNQDKIKLKL